METLKFDSGLVTYNINDKAQVTFNPTDSSFAERLYSAFEILVMSRVMRKIDFGIWQKSITGGGLTALWLLFSRQGAKGQGRRYAARLALDAL